MLIREHMNRMVAVVCVIIVLVVFTLCLASAALVVAALHIPHRGQRSTTPTTTEVESTAPPLHRNKSRRTLRPRAMVEAEVRDGVIRDSRCVAPRLVHCSSNLTALVKDHGWFYMPGAGYPGGCIEWLPAHLCAAHEGFPAGGGYRYNSTEECSSLCERGMPRKECTQPLPLSAFYNCTHPANRSQQHWWFYDPVSHACRDWEDVCVYKSYATMAECVHDCLPEPPRS